MNNIIIIGQNESISIEPMIESLEKYFSGSRRIWVLDRCTDDSEKKLVRYKEEYHATPSSLSGRQTSFARNYGLKFTDSQSDVIFLDGDRYITSNSSFNKPECDISLFTLEEDDYRNNMRNLEGAEIDYMRDIYGRPVNFFYSCGLFIKRKAINKVLTFQKGELFSTELQDEWGVEDLYLGDVCYHLGLSCEINKNIRLHGRFSNNRTSINALKKRFILRDRLNVKW